MPVSRRPIPQEVQTRHNFRQEYSNHSKFGLYIKRSLSYWTVLFVNFYVIRYGDTVEQTTCTFQLDSRQLYTTASPYVERDAICPAGIERENVHVVCSTVSP